VTLRHLPLPLMASVLGLGGLGLMWRQAATALGVPGLIGEVVLALMTLVFVTLTTAHAVRLARHSELVRTEFRSPILAPFFSIFAIGGLMVAGAGTPYWPAASRLLWEVSVIAQLGLGGVLLARWLRGEADPAMMAPPLIIPFVAAILAAVFGPPLGHPEVAWAMLGLGLIFWLVLQALLLHRLLGGPPLPPALRPSIMILLAPPSVGAVALLLIEGRVGPMALGLAGLASLYAMALLLTVRHMTESGFSLVWWSFTFPCCAYAILLMMLVPGVLAWIALAAATLVVLGVAWGTVRHLMMARPRP
jgi:tellurite resistance protein